MSVIHNRSSAKDAGPAQVRIYRPFFLAGILSVLTTGCLFGAIALLGIAQRQSYTANGWTPYVLAHANSQLYGWVGLFVMGFALQHHPPRQSRVRLFHRLAISSLALIVVSIALRFGAEALITQNRTFWMAAGALSGLCQAAAVLLFVINISLTRHRVIDEVTGKPAGLPWQSSFVFASLGWWMFLGLAEPVVFALSHQSDPTENILFVARWFVPYREAQFLGFAANMVFGVALSRMSGDFGARPPHKALGWLAFYWWNLGLISRGCGWLKYFQSGMAEGYDRLYVFGGVLMALGAFCVVLSSHLFQSLSIRLVSHKFLRGAFLWLLISGVMFLAESIYLHGTGQAFSHPYTGALRHALTVGFLSQMILGVALHFIPRLRGWDTEQIRPLWSVFWLLNIGNAGRVAGEIVTNFTPTAFAPMGITGFIELAGLVIWAVYMVRLLFGSQYRTRPSTIRQIEDVSQLPFRA